MDLDPQKILAAPVVAGAAGSVVALKFAPGASWAERMTNVASGSAFAAFIAPAMSEYFHIASPQMLSCLSFALGLFGMSIAAALFTGVKGIDVASILTGWFKKGG